MAESSLSSALRLKSKKRQKKSNEAVFFVFGFGFFKTKAVGALLLMPA